MEVYLLRHTRVALGGQYCYGISDIDLADTQQEDIQELVAKLDGIQFDRIYTSPLKRCKALASAMNRSADVEDALTEMDFGDWELKKWSAIGREQLDDWMNDFVHIAPPMAETYLEFSRKSVAFFNELTAGAGEKGKVLLITHSGPIRAIICHVLNLSLSRAFNFEVDYGSISKIEVVDNWNKVKYLNVQGGRL